MRKRKFEYACTDIESVENYEIAKVDNFRGWICHHRLETHNSDGEKRAVPIKAEELKALGIYYDRPPEELIFLTKSEHSRMHALVQTRTEEHRKKMSESHIGKPGSRLGSRPSEETRKKTSETLKKRYKEGYVAPLKGMKLKMVDGKRVYYRPEEIK